MKYNVLLLIVSILSYSIAKKCTSHIKATPLHTYAHTHSHIDVVSTPSIDAASGAITTSTGSPTSSTMNANDTDDTDDTDDNGNSSIYGENPTSTFSVAATTSSIAASLTTSSIYAAASTYGSSTGSPAPLSTGTAGTNSSGTYTVDDHWTGKE